MFTPVAIEGTFLNPDDTAASGTLCLTPSTALVNSDEPLEEQGTEPVCGVLDSEGRITAQSGLALIANATDDTATTPVGAYYVFQLQLDGQLAIEFNSPLPHDVVGFRSGAGVCVDVAATTTIDEPVVQLVNLIAASSMVGATVTGENFEGEPTVLSIDASANTITLSANATATGVDGSLTVESGCILFGALQANAL